MRWVELVAITLPGLAAVAALLFTWVQVGQASRELRISEQGQITTRFNAAVTNLGSQTLDVRLGGIYALQRIMQDSARDHPTIVSVLAAFAQEHAGSSKQSMKEPTDDVAGLHTPKADVTAAITALAKRRPDRDNGTVIDLGTTDLRGLALTDNAAITLPGAIFLEADLRFADFTGADLRQADFQRANLERALLEKANLRGALLTSAQLRRAALARADLRGADLTCGGFGTDSSGRVTSYVHCAVLEEASMDGADFRDAKMIGANLLRASLNGADFRGADLTDADLRDASLNKADFRGAKLTGVKLHGTDRAGTRGLAAGG